LPVSLELREEAGVRSQRHAAMIVPYNGRAPLARDCGPAILVSGHMSLIMTDIRRAFANGLGGRNHQQLRA
jgi:hypothetical protein